MCVCVCIMKARISPKSMNCHQKPIMFFWWAERSRGHAFTRVSGSVYRILDQLYWLPDSEPNWKNVKCPLLIANLVNMEMFYRSKASCCVPLIGHLYARECAPPFPAPQTWARRTHPLLIWRRRTHMPAAFESSLNTILNTLRLPTKEPWASPHKLVRISRAGIKT